MLVRAVVADDNTVVLSTIQRVLGASLDVSVVGAARTGNDALRMIREQHPDVAVLDVGMPGGGAALVRQVRALPAPPWVLIFSGRDDPETVQDMLAAGATGYVTKGGLTEDLAGLVRRCARGERVGLAAADQQRDTLDGPKE